PASPPCWTSSPAISSRCPSSNGLPAVPSVLASSINIVRSNGTAPSRRSASACATYSCTDSLKEYTGQSPDNTGHPKESNHTAPSDSTRTPASSVTVVPATSSAVRRKENSRESSDFRCPTNSPDKRVREAARWYASIAV